MFTIFRWILNALSMLGVKFEYFWTWLAGSQMGWKIFSFTVLLGIFGVVGVFIRFTQWGFDNINTTLSDLNTQLQDTLAAGAALTPSLVVIDGLAMAAWIFPFDETFALLLICGQLAIAVLGYRLIKHWIPFF